MPYGSDPTAAPQDIDPRQRTVNAWMTKGGVPRHVAEGIADNVGRESSFRPDAVGDGGTSVGLYQAHGERKSSLEAQGDLQDPDAHHQWAISQVHGGDKIATEHWGEIRGAKSREEARDLFKKYFERPAEGGYGKDPVIGKGKWNVDDRAIFSEQNRSDGQVVWRDPHDFLAELPPMDDDKEPAGARQKRELDESLDRGDKIEEIPHADVQVKDGRAKIIDYDGRHRAQRAIEEGVNLIPVSYRGIPKGSEVKEFEPMRGEVRPWDFKAVNTLSPKDLARPYSASLRQDPLGEAATSPGMERDRQAQYAADRHAQQAQQKGDSYLSESASALGDAARGIPRALGEMAQGLVGLGERAELAQQQEAGAPPREPAVPLSGGEELGGLSTFVAGGLPQSLRPQVDAARTISQAPLASAGNAMRQLTPEGENMMAAAQQARGMEFPRPVPMERLTPERAMLAQDALQRGIPVTGPQNAATQVARERALATAISHTFGEDAPALSAEVLARAQKRIGDGLNRIEQGHHVPFDPEFRNEWNEIATDAHSQLTMPGQISVVDKHLKDVMVDSVKTEAAKKAAQTAPKAPGKAAPKPKEVLRSGLSGEQFGNLIHEKGPISKLANNPDPGVALFGDRMEKALRDMLQRRLPTDKAAEYQGLRYQYKNLKTAEKATGSVGEVDPAKLDSAVNRAFPNRKRDKGAELVKLSDIANEFVKKAPAGPGGDVGRRLGEFSIGGAIGHAIGAPFGLGGAGRVAGELLSLGLDTRIRNMMRPRLTEALITRALQQLPPPGARRDAINAMMSRSGANTLTQPITGAGAGGGAPASVMRTSGPLASGLPGGTTTSMAINTPPQPRTPQP